MWEIGWRQGGAVAAQKEAEVRRVGASLVELVEREGFRLLLAPAFVVGGTHLDPPDLERLEAVGGAELTWRSRAVDSAINAAGSLDAAREFTERSVLDLNRELNEVMRLSQQQCADVVQMAQSFDATGGLGEALAALEGELSKVGERVRAALSAHLADVGGAAAGANDIVKLAATVTQIAHSARVLTFNARLESARLGPEGRGFVVIAGAIRELAGNVSASNDLVTDVATDLVTKLPVLQRATADLASTTDAQLASVRDRLASLRDSFQKAREQALLELKRAEAAASEVHHRSCDVVHHLQFQDRTSQLLTRVREQVQAMEAVLGLSEAKPDDVLLRVGELGRKLEDQAAGLAPGAVALF